MDSANGHTSIKSESAKYLTQILKELKQQITAKYPVIEMLVFGSKARGEDTPDSDIDVFVRLPAVTRTIEEDLFDMAHDLELKYDCLIDIIILSDSLLCTHAEYLPIYQRIVS